MSNRHKLQSSPDQILKQYGSTVASISVPDKSFADNLYDALSAKYLSQSQQLTAMDKFRIFLKEHPLRFAGISAVSFFALGLIVALAIPSFRAQVNQTFATVFNQTEQQISDNEEIETVIDTEPPIINVSSPADKTTTSESKIEVSGNTESDAELLINGITVTTDAGKFSKSIDLILGENKISVKAIDKSGNTSESNIIVTRTEPVVATETKPATSSVPQSKINLAAKAFDKGIELTWSVNGVNVDKGYKLLKSNSDSTPSYPENSAVYIDKGGSRSYKLFISDGKSYYFRLCQYTGDGCGVYSNVVKATSPKSPEVKGTTTGGVTSIVLSGTGTNFSWVASGSAPKGYKLLWSTISGPTYPTREGDSSNYYNNNSGSISPKDSGTYFVRVCEYTGNGCGVYSNQLTVEVVK